MHPLPNTNHIGIDLGGTSIRIGIYDPAWILLDSISMVTRVSAGPDAVIDDIAAGVRTLWAKSGGEAHLPPIGIGSPGPLNLREGALGHLPNFPGWDGFPIRSALEDALKTTIHLDSDANAAALAEWKAGAGSGNGTGNGIGVDSLCMLTLGTGVGNGIILDGRIWHGMVGMGGEAGHIPLVPDGPLCGCGSRGCLEVFASATALCRLAREAAASSAAGSKLPSLVERHFTARDVAALAAEGDEAAIKVYENLGYYLGYALSGLINTLDLPLYVIGGGLVSAWSLFGPAMFRTVRDHSYIYRLSEPSQLNQPERDKTAILPAWLGPSAGLLGAAMLTMQPPDAGFSTDTV